MHRIEIRTKEGLRNPHAGSRRSRDSREDQNRSPRELRRGGDFTDVPADLARVPLSGEGQRALQQGPTLRTPISDHRTPLSHHLDT